MKGIQTAIVIASVLLSGPAWADSAAPINYSGTYVEWQGGWATMQDSMQPPPPPSKNPFAAGLAYGILYDLGQVFNGYGKINVGYQFNQHYALQAGYMNTSVTFANNYYDATLQYYDVAGKGMYPISKHFSLIGLLGLVYIHQRVITDINWCNGVHDGIVPEVGGGIAVNFTPKFNMSFSALLIPGINSVNRTLYFPLGISYRF